MKKMNNGTDMSYEELLKLSDEELFKVSLERTPKNSRDHGNYTDTALMAQKIRLLRDNPWADLYGFIELYRPEYYTPTEDKEAEILMERYLTEGRRLSVACE